MGQQNYYRIRLMDMRKQINAIIDKELSAIDDDELRAQTENDKTIKLPNEESEVLAESVTAGKPERE
jgi:hypothetical protein